MQITPVVNEEWRPIPKAPGYAISNLGRVKSLPRAVTRANRWGTISPHRVRERILKFGAQESGHLFAVFHVGEKQFADRVHRLVMQAFGPPEPFPGALVRHRDGDPKNNRIDNLVWGSQLDNMIDAARHGTLRRCCPVKKEPTTGKLPPEKVAEMRRLYHEEAYSTRRIADMFGIGKTSAWRAISGRGWV